MLAALLLPLALILFKPYPRVDIRSGGPLYFDPARMRELSTEFKRLNQGSRMSKTTFALKQAGYSISSAGPTAVRGAYRGVRPDKAILIAADLKGFSSDADVLAILCTLAESTAARAHESNVELAVSDDGSAAAKAAAASDRDLVFLLEPAPFAGDGLVMRSLNGKTLPLKAVSALKGVSADQGLKPEIINPFTAESAAGMHVEILVPAGERAAGQTSLTAIGRSLERLTLLYEDGVMSESMEPYLPLGRLGYLPAWLAYSLTAIASVFLLCRTAAISFFLRRAGLTSAWRRKAMREGTRGVLLMSAAGLAAWLIASGDPRFFLPVLPVAGSIFSTRQRRRRSRPPKGYGKALVICGNLLLVTLVCFTLWRSPHLTLALLPALAGAALLGSSLTDNVLMRCTIAFSTALISLHFIDLGAWGLAAPLLVGVLFLHPGVAVISAAKYHRGEKAGHRERRPAGERLAEAV